MHTYSRKNIKDIQSAYETIIPSSNFLNNSNYKINTNVSPNITEQQILNDYNDNLK